MITQPAIGHTMTTGHTAPMPPPDQQHNPKPYFQVSQRVVCVDAVPNRLASDRKLLVAGRIYVIRAIDMDGGWKFPWWGVHLEGIWIFHPDGRGEWAFRDGVSTPLGPEPQICKYEQLHERPGPFYIEPDWTEEAQAARR